MGLVLSAAVPVAKAGSSDVRNDLAPPTLAPIIRQVMPSIVAVTSVRSPKKVIPIEPGDGFPSPPPPQAVRGSGVIINGDRGLLVTANHLIERSEKTTVKLLGGREMNATVVATSSSDDLAILRIDPSDLVPVELNQNDDLQVGDFVLAIGDPLDGGPSVTFGIVSGLGRAGPGITNTDLIATDLLIAQGNSGGPLLNLRGELVGINSIRLGSGFTLAVPVSAVRRLLTGM